MRSVKGRTKHYKAIGITLAAIWLIEARLQPQCLDIRSPDVPMTDAQYKWRMMQANIQYTLFHGTHIQRTLSEMSELSREQIDANSTSNAKAAYAIFVRNNRTISRVRLRDIVYGQRMRLAKAKAEKSE